MAVWYSLWPFGIVFPIWYVWAKKNLATLVLDTDVCIFYVLPKFRMAVWYSSLPTEIGAMGPEIESRLLIKNKQAGDTEHFIFCVYRFFYRVWRWKSCCKHTQQYVTKALWFFTPFICKHVSALNWALFMCFWFITARNDSLISIFTSRRKKQVRLV
jgi:hypothetical protein